MGVDCEFSHERQVDLALCAKKNGLDAIHDTAGWHRDEARHGRALKGLLERYFKLKPQYLSLLREQETLSSLFPVTAAALSEEDSHQNGE